MLASRVREVLSENFTGRRRWLAFLMVLVALVALQPIWINPYSITVIRDVIIFGLFALSLDYLWGKGGLLTFGHAAFFGIGAYGTAVISLAVGGSHASLAGMGAGVMLAGVVASMVGYFLIFGGVRGPYFTIVTLAVALVMEHIAIGWVSVTGGDSGLIGTPPLIFDLFGMRYGFFSPTAQYYLVLVIATIAVIAIWVPCSGHYGKVLAAIQDNEDRAATLGHNTSGYLLFVFVSSAMLAALAGSLYAIASGYVAPDLTGLLLSTEVIVWVSIGGRATLIGPFIGAFIVIRLQQEISSFDPRLWPLAIGVFFVSMVFLFPNGLLSLGSRALELVKSRSRVGGGNQ